MTDHTTGTRTEWLAARLELLRAEKEHTRQADELARRRQELPWVRIENEYRFETDEGTASLADLFRGRSQLLVYHFMFGYGDDVDERNPGCTACSFVADHFDAVVPHLNGHDVTLVAESIAPLEELRRYKQRMGWRFPWVSSLGSDFKYDFGAAFTDEQQRQRRRVQLPPHPRSRGAGAGDERVRARRRDRLPHLLHLRARGRAADGDLPVLGPGAARPQRDRVLVAPPRRVRHTG